MPNAALSSQHTASLILAASKGSNWRNIDLEAVLNGSIPACYIMTKERMEQARRLPEIGESQALAGQIRL